MTHYEIFISVDGQKGVVRVGSSHPLVRGGSHSAITYALNLTEMCYPDAVVEFDFIKEYTLDDEPDVGYVYEAPTAIQTYH
jgi:hypothetical protein